MQRYKRKFVDFKIWAQTYPPFSDPWLRTKWIFQCHDGGIISPSSTAKTARSANISVVTIRDFTILSVFWKKSAFPEIFDLSLQIAFFNANYISLQQAYFKENIFRIENLLDMHYPPLTWFPIWGKWKWDKNTCKTLWKKSSQYMTATFECKKTKFLTIKRG